MTKLTMAALDARLTALETAFAALIAHAEAHTAAKANTTRLAELSYSELHFVKTSAERDLALDPERGELRTLIAEIDGFIATNAAQTSAKARPQPVATNRVQDRTPADLDAFCARYLPNLLSRYNEDRKMPVMDGSLPRWIQYIERVYADRGFTTAERLYDALDKALGRNLYGQLKAVRNPNKLPSFLARLFAEMKEYDAAIHAATVVETESSVNAPADAPAFTDEEIPF